MSKVGADPPRDSIVARVSDLNAPMVAGDAGSEIVSGGRSGDPMTIVSDLAGPGVSRIELI